MYSMYLPGALGGWKRELDPLALALQLVASLQVSAEG